MEQIIGPFIKKYLNKKNNMHFPEYHILYNRLIFLIVVRIRSSYSRIRKQLHFIQMPYLSKNIQFGSTVKMYYGKTIKWNSCYVNQSNLYNIITEYLHKIHINISCHSISPKHMSLKKNDKLKITKFKKASFICFSPASVQKIWLCLTYKNNSQQKDMCTTNWRWTLLELY